MNNKPESTKERLERMKREKEAATAAAPTENLIGQLTHETTGEPDFSEIAKKLRERQEREAKGENEDHVKMTIYVRTDLAESFNALITKRGQQKEFVNQALADFVAKKVRELGL